MLLHRTTRVHSDYLSESSEVSAYPAEVVDAKISVEHSKLAVHASCSGGTPCICGEPPVHISTTFLGSTEVSAVPAVVVVTKTSVAPMPFV